MAPNSTTPILGDGAPMPGEISKTKKTANKLAKISIRISVKKKSTNLIVSKTSNLPATNH